MNKGLKYDLMVKEKTGDELGLFTEYEEIIESVREKINLYKSNSVIDIGCGTANLTGLLSENIKVIGIDKNKEMIQVAKDKFPNMNFIECDIEEIDNIEKADIVVSSYVLHGLAKETQKSVINKMIKLSESNRVILVDYMFGSSINKNNYIDQMKRANRIDLVNFICSKNYMIVDELKEYIESLKLNIKERHIINFSWVIEIYK